MYLGEIISLLVALSWTITALVAEVASKRVGPQVLNVWRMFISLLLLMCMLWITTGVVWPRYADMETWLWLLASGLVGYVFGDYCLFNSYVYIGSRWGQLFMTVAPIAASFTAWIMLGEKLSLQALLAITITLSGICLSIVGRNTKHLGHHAILRIKLPLKGVLYGIGGGVGQGVGLVMSKIGMQHYDACIPDDADAIGQAMPFASTMMRACMGFVGLLAIIIIKGDAKRLPHALRDSKGMWCTVAASVTGPFIGVSLSLMALMYTSAGVAQTLMSLTPVFILWPAYVLFRERITMREIIGAVISICGVMLFFI